MQTIMQPLPGEHLDEFPAPPARPRDVLGSPVPAASPPLKRPYREISARSETPGRGRVDFAVMRHSKPAARDAEALEQVKRALPDDSKVIGLSFEGQLSMLMDLKKRLELVDELLEQAREKDGSLNARLVILTIDAQTKVTDRIIKLQTLIQKAEAHYQYVSEFMAVIRTEPKDVQRRLLEKLASVNKKWGVR